MQTQSYSALGIMSGTSLDGLDLAFVRFSGTENGWKYSIEQAETITYTDEWKNKLKNAASLSGQDLTKLHVEYGNFTGKTAKNFIDKHNIIPDLIASHGHTVFHDPGQGFTYQIGHGANIAIQSGVLTVSDFRSTDVALGGQGAPLVPVGDSLLFSGFKYCLNLGGFSNISFEKQNKRIAFDICPVNIALNHVVNKLSLAFDKSGEIGKSGDIIISLLHQLNALDYYKQKPPKSLSREWLENHFLPLIEHEYLINNLLRTLYEHISDQISMIINTESLNPEDKILVTGGGAHNSFLIELLQQKTKAGIVVPDNQTVDFKEALIFAFLGVLRVNKQVNCLSSVTGAIKNNIGGCIYLP